MILLRWALLGALFFFMAGVAACATSQKNDAPLTVELLVSEPAAYEGKLIELHAIVETHRHGINLVDYTGSHKAILLDIPISVETNSDVEEFLERTYEARRDSGALQMEANFVGVFNVVEVGVPRRTLKLQEVKDLDVTTVDDAKGE